MCNLSGLIEMWNRYCSDSVIYQHFTNFDFIPSKMDLIFNPGIRIVLFMCFVADGRVL